MSDAALPAERSGMLVSFDAPSALARPGRAALLAILALGEGQLRAPVLPLLLPFAAYLGMACARHVAPGAAPARSLAMALLLGVVAHGGWMYSRYMAREDVRASPVLALGEDVRAHTEGDALVVAVDAGNPTLLYHLHRKGWHAFADDLGDTFLSEQASHGARYLAGLRSSFTTAPENEAPQHPRHARADPRRRSRLHRALARAVMVARVAAKAP
jgi:hypothetical protein